MQYSPALGLPTAAGCRCGRSGCSSRTEDGAHSFLGPCHLLHRAARGCRQHRKRHSCRNWAGEGMGSCRMPPELWSGAAGAGGASHPPVAVLTDRGLALGDPSAKCSCNCLAQKGSVAPGTGRGRRGKPTSKSSVRKGVRTTRFIFFPLRCLLPYPGGPLLPLLPARLSPRVLLSAPQHGTLGCIPSVLAGSLRLPLAHPEPVTHTQPLPSHPCHVPPPLNAR